MFILDSNSVKYKTLNFAKFFVFLCSIDNCVTTQNPSSKISAQVWSQLQNGETPDIMVDCNQVLGTRSAKTKADIFNKISRLVETSDTRNDPQGVQVLTELLTNYEQITNLILSPLVNLLRRLGIDFNGFWIGETIFARGVTLAQVLQIIGLDVVVFIRMPGVIPLPPPIGSRRHINPPPPSSNDELWNINLVDARCSAITKLGEGVIAGSMDTGVLWDHEQLIGNWIGPPYGWLNGTIEIQETQFPNDNNGHGTHTTGTVVGKTVGVAPDAQWMACGMGDGPFTEAAIMTCGQWMAWPYKWDDETQNKITKNAAARPHVINNSWGGPGGSLIVNPNYGSSYYKMFSMWNALGIVSPTAMGNRGPSCGSGDYPGNFDHIMAVGALDITATIAYFSARGPTIMGRPFTKNSTAFGNCLAPPGGVASCTDVNPICVMVKPDISGPGVDVTSSWNTNTTSYNTISGTSMATPHVTAIAALIISTRLNAGWNYRSIYKIVTKTTNRDLIDLKGVGKSASDSYARSSNVLCNFISAGICDDWPNNVYGTGLISACGAVKFAKTLTLADISKLSRGDDVSMKSKSKRFSFLDFV